MSHIGNCPKLGKIVSYWERVYCIESGNIPHTVKFTYPQSEYDIGHCFYRLIVSIILVRSKGMLVGCGRIVSKRKDR